MAIYLIAELAWKVQEPEVGAGEAHRIKSAVGVSNVHVAENVELLHGKRMLVLGAGVNLEEKE